jgi:GNAT superfamily N-acetyltransferase
MERLLRTLPHAERRAVTESLERVQKILSSAERGADTEAAAEIRRANLAQAGDAEILLNEYYREIGVIQTDTPEAIRNLLSHSDSGFWIAYVAETPAGCVALRPLEKFRSSAECKRLYVRAQFRRRGIAEALLDVMEDYARSASLRFVYLDSMRKLEAALALYRRRGYAPCERYNENTQATVFLRKSLKRRFEE